MTAQDSLFDDQATSYARISRDLLYRYTLGRVWNPAIPPATFVMLNPSTADASYDDPTIRRCIGFARSWNLGGIHVVNLYAARCTDPKGLLAFDDPHGPENDDELRAALDKAAARDEPVIVAWGSWPGPDPSRPLFVDTLAMARGVELHSLGVTKSGQPRHPLYLRGDATPSPWTAP